VNHLKQAGVMGQTPGWTLFSFWVPGYANIHVLGKQLEVDTGQHRTVTVHGTTPVTGSGPLGVT
jgi:hypothetical protein